MTRRSGNAYLAAMLLAFSVSPAGGQDMPAVTTLCAGQIVRRVEIRASPPPFAGTAQKWQAAARSVGLHHATTQDGVIAAFLSLETGRPCNEYRRAESERVLRAQSFLADATVTVEPDSGGTVAVMVRTVDEVPVRVGARFRGVSLQSMALGNENVAGAALRLEGRFERNGAYRTGFGGRVEADALFGRPYLFRLDADRFAVGHQVSAELEHPIFTDLQHVSWHVGAVSRENYLPFERPANDPLVLQADDQNWDIGGLLRIFGTHTVALLGGAVSGRRFDPAAAGVVMDSTGLRADTGSALTRRYTPFHAARLGVTGGLRRVTFRSVDGFDALVGSQDVPSGITVGLLAAHGLSTFGENDVFLSSALYAGAATSRAWIGTLAEVEGRRDPATATWNSVIGSARTALYLGGAPGAVLIIADEVSAGKDPRLPLQLTFRDPIGGLMGYRNSGLAGGRRNVIRGELRFSGASVVRRADVGVATFGEAGRLWAGDVPYGVDATRATVGVSLLAAYPSRSKRLYRVDLAIPLTRGANGGGSVEVRFSSADRTQGFWTEPSDVARARTGTEPSKLFAWPTH